MSALGQKQTLRGVRSMSALPPKADMQGDGHDVRFCAMCGRLRVGKKNRHVTALVGAAMCSAFKCGSHHRWP